MKKVKRKAPPTCGRCGGYTLAPLKLNPARDHKVRLCGKCQVTKAGTPPRVNSGRCGDCKMPTTTGRKVLNPADPLLNQLLCNGCAARWKKTGRRISKPKTRTALRWQTSAERSQRSIEITHPDTERRIRELAGMYGRVKLFGSESAARQAGLKTRKEEKNH